MPEPIWKSGSGMDEKETKKSGPGSSGSYREHGGLNATDILESVHYTGTVPFITVPVQFYLLS